MFFKDIFFGIFLTSLAHGKVIITSPKEGEWLPFLDEDKTLEIRGNASELPVGAELVLLIDEQRADKKQSWKQKIGKDGSFTFKVSQNLISPDIQTNLKVSAVDKNGKEIEAAKRSIYCCSPEGVGYFNELASGKAHLIKITNPQSMINGVEINIPSNILKSPSSVVVTEAAVQQIRLKKYIPLSVAVRVHFSDIKSEKGIKYSIKATPNIPRNDMATPISTEDWSQITGKDWKSVDLKSAKIAILASSDSGFQWDEFSPDAVVGDKVTFTFSEKMKGNSIFVVVAVVGP